MAPPRRQSLYPPGTMLAAPLSPLSSPITEAKIPGICPPEPVIVTSEEGNT